jgi:hypothetical protein
MKKHLFFLVFVIGAGFLGVYGQTKNDDILKLLRISGTAKLSEQMVAAMIPNFKQLVPDIPDVFWDRFMAKLNVDELLYSCIPAYDKYYTHDEIKQLIIFYESPIGKKTVEVTPLLLQETMAVGEKWGEKLGQDVVRELMKEGYLKQ